MGEQPNPWDLLQPQDVTSRHRGAKPPRRCELLGEISLLSPEYLLSFERWPFHAEPPDHYAYFRTCSTCQSHSQAPLCHYTLRTITNRTEGTFEKPPLLFWRRPPQSNYPPCTVPFGVRHQTSKGWYFKDDSTSLASTLQSLPPILHITYPMSMQSCSKGSRGLFVPLRVIGIFTDTTISPSSWLRQCPDRYTIRAGRNLPDKEFRYLRTVIVTAAVYWGFNSELRRS